MWLGFWVEKSVSFCQTTRRLLLNEVALMHETCAAKKETDRLVSRLVGSIQNRISFGDSVRFGSD